MRFFLAILIFYGAFSLWAQVHNFLTVDIENDFFDCRGHGSDQYYTAGNSVCFLHSSQVSHHALSLSLHQQAFTPSDLQDSSLLLLDYPYAGLLFLEGRYYKSASDSSWYGVIYTSFGVTGTTSGVAPVQQWVHQLLGDEAPRGWHHILELGAFYQSTFALYKTVYRKERFHLNVLQQWEWGTIYNRVVLGLQSKSVVGKVSFSLSPTLTWVINNKILEKGLFQKTIYEKPFPASYLVSKKIAGISGEVTFYGKRAGVSFRQSWWSRETSVTEPHHVGALRLILYLSHNRK
jgi:hypothetical protein